MGCGVSFAQSASEAPPVSPTAVESHVPGAPPSQGYVWMSGHWNSEGGQWKWIAAHWDLPPSRSAMWVGGHWVSSSGNWVWVNGAWNVTDAQQAQAGPPVPPGQYPQAGVPTPSTPGPYVNGQFQGQYATGGIVRAPDQSPVDTDYGTVDYSTAYPAYGYPGYAYPAYGWVGDPWFWGFPGVALGFGFGPGFHGGGFFRGGHGFVGRGGFAARGFGGRSVR
jgi:hypothetical protein